MRGLIHRDLRVPRQVGLKQVRSILEPCFKRVFELPACLCPRSPDQVIFLWATQAGGFGQDVGWIHDSSTHLNSGSNTY